MESKNKNLEEEAKMGADAMQGMKATEFSAGRNQTNRKFNFIKVFVKLHAYKHNIYIIYYINM